MALKTTTWEPDTCGCVLRFEWDDAVPEDATLADVGITIAFTRLQN